jgi:hypothetical protein
MTKLFAVLAAVIVLAAACSGDDTAATSDEAVPTQAADDGAQTNETTNSTDAPPAGLPPECVETPYDLAVSATGIDGLDGEFTVATAYAKPQPIVPDPDQGGDGGDGQSQEDFLEAVEESKQLAAETDLLLYAIWLADFPFEESDIAFLGGPRPEAGGTVFALTIVPTDEGGFAAGDTVNATAEFGYDTFTTFAPMGSYMLTDLAPESFVLYIGDPPGTAEILHLDEDWICVRWDDAASTRQPDGDLTISGTILAPLTEREALPFN